MNWDVEIAKRVQKQIKVFPKKDTTRILISLDRLVKNPYQGDIEKIEGEKNIWRKRVGSYRALYEVFPKQKFIHILNIQRRTSVAYRH